MRLALVLLFLHFFISGSLPRPQPPGTGMMSFDITNPRCTHVLQPLVVASELFDVVNTRNQLVRYPQARETDWWTAEFAGPQRRNIVGIAAGIALLDFIKWRLTAHSPALRCAAEANQLETTIEAISVTHAR